MTEWTRETPWRQGHLLTQDVVKTLGLLHQDNPEDTLVMVVTHDCDLASPEQSEPHVEIIIGCRIDRIDGNFSNAKSLGKLHLSFDGHPSIVGQFISAEKQSIKKAVLAGHLPLAALQLSPDNKNILQSWLASRYRRSSFPNGFINRLDDKLKEKIAKAVKAHKDKILEVLFDLDKGADIERTEIDDPYTLGITILFSIRENEADAESAANELAAAIHTAFKKKFYDEEKKDWSLIEIDYCDAISENALSYRSFSQLKPWRLEQISLAAVPQIVPPN
jgi:hypothetical protein